ncbi:hypothetical protein [Brevundimonas sp.]|uniref:hypothetical protein n=1 Tax=Brevundimonas sp. TaxID=1871086 RepID=UPI00286C0248|nr:hypothetical protein [Brevundimonas sp.]
MNDNAGGRGGVGIRLYTTGGEVVRRTFDQVGDSGKRMWAQIATGERSANPAMRALSAASNDVQAGFTGMAGRVGPAGNALSAFGVAGVAAAAALGAVAIAGANLRESVKWAADLTDAADRIGITTEALQTLRYSADETGVPIDGLETSLQKLNGTLGAMRTGLGDARVKGAFAELGISSDDLEGLTNASQLLPLIADRISKVGDQASRVQILKKLQIEQLEPLLRGGAAGLAEMSGEASNLGAVLNDSVVKGLDEADRALERNQQLIDANVRQMQSSMAPFFVWASGELAKLSRGIVDFFSGLNKVEDRNDRVLATRSESLQRSVTRSRQQAERGIPMSQVALGWERELAEVNAEIASRARERIARQTAIVAPASEPPDRPPVVRAGGGGTVRSPDVSADRAAAEAERTRQALDREEFTARRTAIQLRWGGDTPEEQARLATELLALDVEDRDAKRAQLLADLVRTGLTEEAARAEMAGLVALDAEADNAERRKVANEHRTAIAERQLAAEETVARDAIGNLEVQGQMARTEAERYEIGRKILEAEQLLELKILDAANRADKIVTKEERDHYQAVLERQALERTAGVVAEEDRIRDIFKQAGRDLVGAIEDGNVGEYIGDKLKARLLDGALESLFSLMSRGTRPGSDSLIGKGLDFLSSTFLKGFANGGYVSGPGGPREDRIPAMLSAGEYVVNAASAKTAGPLLDRINFGGPMSPRERFALQMTPERGPPELRIKR